jgi:release factor glutamine methyltransferase
LKAFDNPFYPLRISKHILNHTYRPLLTWYLQKERNYRLRDVSIVVPKGVFHPGFFFSTRFLLSELKLHDLKNKTLLELGCGSGLISIVAAKSGACVTASDINPQAVSAAVENAKRNAVPLISLQSDVFSDIPTKQFDYIIINPPYYRGEAGNAAQKAWYAGPELDYFEKLFSQIGNFMGPEAAILMVLSEDCEISEIIKMARSRSLNLVLRRTKSYCFEKNFIYEITVLE